MKKLLFIFGGVALLSFQACQQDTSNAEVDTNTDGQTNQSVMDVDNTGTSGRDTSTANMEDHTRMNQAADDADPNR